MTPTYRDRARYRKCLDCDNLVLPPRRKCNACRKTKTYTTTDLGESRRGRRKRGLSLTKADKNRTRRAKRQNPPQGGPKPLRAYTFRADKT